MQLSQTELLLEDYHLVTADRVDSLSNLKNQVVLITGGTGFMGKWIVGLLAFLNDQYGFNTKIILLARHIDLFKSRTPHLAGRNDIEFIASDVKFLQEVPSETNWVIHAAATPDNRVHATNPIETMYTIANGTQSILRAIERCSNLKMFLNISSGLIYGQQPLDQSNLNEHAVGSINCGTVSSAYAEAKRYAETLCHSARSQSRMPIVTARPFAFMGPFQSIETPWALNNFIKDAINNKPINLLGDGNTVRSYMYASDMAFWMLSILTRGQSGEIYNVGSPEHIRLSELAIHVRDIANSTQEINIKSNGSQLQSSRFVPDVSFAMKNLDLNISVDLKTALQRTIQWNILCKI